MRELVRRPDALISALRSENPGMGELSDAELAAAIEILRELHDDGSSGKLDELYMADFWRKPPTIQEFINDDYYLGGVCKPDADNGQLGLIPELRGDLIEAFREDREIPCAQLLLSGAIGQGKTWCGMIAMLFRLAKALCLRSPLTYYGLSAATTLNAYILSITREQVQDGAFGDCINMMRMSPFFIECCAEDLTKKEFRGQAVRFRRNILLQAGSKARHAIGKNTLLAFIDEANFRIEKDSQKAAKDMYDAITRRTRSRFGNSNDGLLVLISSSRNETDFLANHIRKNLKNPAMKIVARSLWEGIGKYRIPYSGTTFLVDPGDPFSLPRIIEQGEDLEKIPMEMQARLIRVPEEHRIEFEGDLPGSIRDVAGISAATQTKFFYNHLHVINTLRDDIDDYLHGKPEVNMSVGDDHEIIDFFDTALLIQQAGTRNRPTRHPSNPRFIHLDMSTGAQDSMGVSMIHPVWSTEIDFIDPMTHIVEKRVMPVYEGDFTFGIRRSISGEPIDFGKVRKFILWLRTNGFPISAITCDLLSMSQEMINILIQNGFDASYLSVDKTKAAYSTLRQVMAEGRIGLPDRPLLFLELVNLDDGQKKVDHPARNTIPWLGDTMREHGTKDESDSLAGAVMKAESRKEAFNLTLYGRVMPQMPLMRVRRSG